MKRRRALRIGLTPTMAFAAIALVGFALRPAPPEAFPAGPRQPALWRGAYHVHSTVSDGSGSAEAIAASAAKAGLDFVILTDHGDATRTPTPPRLLHGVLMIDGVEISTDDGHYVALDLPRAPYPLAGEGRAVADDVRRLGGIGIVAHPDSPRRALAWHDMSVDADGFEWLNADSTWRGAPAATLTRRLISYPFAPAGSLAGLARYPATLVATFDRPERRPSLVLAAVDAHARVGWSRRDDPVDGGRTLARVPSYHAMLGTMGLVVPWLDAAPSGDPQRDARVVLHAIRHRLTTAAMFAMASAPWVAIDLVGPDDDVAGVDARGAASLTIRSNAPPAAEIRLRRNGVLVETLSPSTTSRSLDAHAAPAIYRAEIWLPARRGWPDVPVAVSGAVAHNQVVRTDTEALVAASTGDRVLVTSWHGEHDAHSSVALATTQAETHATLTLASGRRVSQFAALVGDLAPVRRDIGALVLDLSATAPMRVSVQLREPRPGEGLRWRQSVYVDQARRQVSLPLATFRPIAPATGVVPVDRLHALLLVMDTVNARPGDARTLTVHGVGWARPPATGPVGEQE